MDGLINTLCSSLFSIYLPIEDTGSRIAISLALSGLIVHIINFMYNNVLQKGFTWFFNRHFTVTIHEDNSMFQKLTSHIYKTHCGKVNDFTLKNESGKNRLIASGSSSNIVETYEYKQKKYQMNISIASTSETKDTKASSAIKISSTSVEAIESYVNDHVMILSNNVSNKIPIHRISVKKFKEKRDVVWTSSSVKLSKNVKNTIVSENVKKNFYDDVHKFIGGEDYYLDRGLPYKRGYLLHGKPGCGKTSLIKAIANQYNIPIFIVDLNLINDNGEFTKLMGDIGSHIVDDQKYVVVFEDIDRTNMMKYSRWGESSKITLDCFLNVLDGLDEYHGRITILTANDISAMEQNPALIRAGRIDTIIEILPCKAAQILAILQFYFKDFDIANANINKSVSVTPSQLTQLIITLNDPEKIVTAVNKQINFDNVNMEVMNSICYEFTDDSVINDEDGNLSVSKSVNGDNSEEEDPGRIRRLKAKIIGMNTAIEILNLKIDKMTPVMDAAGESDKISLEQWKLNKRTLEFRIAKNTMELEIFNKHEEIRAASVANKTKSKKRSMIR